MRNALPRTPVPCGRRTLSATERRKSFAQRLASHKAPLEAVPIQAPAELRVRILSESPYGARRLAAAVRSLAMPGIEWRDEAPACHRLERGEQGTGRPSTVDEGAGATVIFT